MKYCFIYTLLFLSLGFVAHDTPMAFFELTIIEDAIEVNMEFEQKALEESIESKFLKDGSNELIKAYLLQHTEWVINEEATALDILSMDKKKGHIYVQAQLKVEGAVKTIGVQNTCLIDDIEGHHNIIRLKQKDRLREFGLFKSRVSMEIKVD